MNIIAKKIDWRWWPTVLAATALAAMALATAVNASPITYEVFNHRDGGAIKGRSSGPRPRATQAQTDADGYILRLKLKNAGTVVLNKDTVNETTAVLDGSDNSFNVNAAAPARGLTGGATFTYDPMTAGDIATLTAYAFHNESGSDSTMFDAADDFYRIVVKLQSILFTDEGSESPKWWGGNTKDVEFDDMIGALIADANDPNRSVEQSSSKSTDVARIYYQVVDLTLTPINDGGGDGFKYTGPLQWDEYPNGATKPLFLQYCWRLGNGCGTLGAAGWLEPFENQSSLRRAPEDLLFQFGNKIPEPATLSVMALGLAAIGFMRRRKRVA